LAHLQGELDLAANSLISIRKPAKSHIEVTDPGFCLCNPHASLMKLLDVLEREAI
jgi:hypothetical protein